MKKKNKSTKKSLVMSAISLVLCVAMLMGTTFAWFTDSVTSSGNIIKSGTLDVTMEWKDATTTGAQQTYQDASAGAIFNYDLWEPGYVEAKNIKISNVGTLALKYNLYIAANGEVSELADVIDVYFAEGEYTLTSRAMTELTKVGTLSDILNGMPANMAGDLKANTADTVTIALKMQEDAGNKYQGLSIGSDFSVVLMATQDNVEKDSFDNTYDTDATYLNTDAQGNYLISNANELVFFAKAINTKIAPYSDAGNTFKLTADIDLGGRRWVPIGRMTDTYGIGESSTFHGNFDGGNHTVRNFNIDTVDGIAGDDTNKGAGLFGAVTGTISNLKVTNATIVTAHWAGTIAGQIKGTVEKCSVENITITCLPELIGTSWDNGDKAGSIVGYLDTNGIVTGCSAKNVDITGYRDLGGIVGCSDGTVTKNTVGENVTITYDNDATRNYNNYTSAAQHNIGDYIGRGADENDTGNTGTANYVRGATAGTAEELNRILAGYASNSGENITVELTKDFDMANNWTTYNIGNYNGVNNLTINGNGHKITNLNKPLLMGAFSGDGVITINDLTISNANISQKAENLGIGAFIMHSDSSGGIVFNNCKLENSFIACTGANTENGSAYAGGFIGYSSSDNTTFKGCSVTNCTISGQKSAGALIGHAQTNLTVDGCTVTGNTISETLEHRTSPGAAAIVGRVSDTPITVKNTTVSVNTIKQGAAVTSSATSVVCANATYTDGGNNTIQ